MLRSLIILVSIAAPSLGAEVVYHNNQKGYLAKPKGEGPFPVVIFNHGGMGPIVGGAPEDTAKALAEAGFVGFSPIRRQAPPLQGHAEDLIAAIQYVKRLDYVDQERIGLIGFSRGGLLTYMAATQREDLDVVVIMAPADGGGALERFLRQADQVTAPALILVAENDTRQANHVAISRQVESALSRKDKEVTLKVYPAFHNDGHHLFFEVRDSYCRDVEAFLKKHLNQ